jgi:hypothetical protein
MVELPPWALEVVECFVCPPAEPDDLRAVVSRISERWEREFVPDVQRLIEKREGTRAPKVSTSVLHVTIWHALFGVQAFEAATEGTRRSAEIEKTAFDLLEKLGDLLCEHTRLGYEGAEQHNPPDFGEVFDRLVRIEAHWALATGVSRTLSAIASTSQSAPTFLHVIESATALWKHDHSAYLTDRRDHRTAFAHGMLDDLQKFECLTHLAKATLINIAANTTENTPESVKALIARRRKKGGVTSRMSVFP